jgi:hypothetical protein
MKDFIDWVSTLPKGLRLFSGVFVKKVRWLSKDTPDTELEIKEQKWFDNLKHNAKLCLITLVTCVILFYSAKVASNNFSDKEPQWKSSKGGGDNSSNNKPYVPVQDSIAIEDSSDETAFVDTFNTREDVSDTLPIYGFDHLFNTDNVSAKNTNDVMVKIVHDTVYVDKALADNDVQVIHVKAGGPIVDIQKPVRKPRYVYKIDSDWRVYDSVLIKNDL